MRHCGDDAKLPWWGWVIMWALFVCVASSPAWLPDFLKSIGCGPVNVSERR